MTVSDNQWLSPAHAGDWLMDVDDRGHPARLVLRRGRTTVLTLPLTSAAEVAAAADRLVISTRIPPGVASQLVAQLAAKLAVTDGRPPSAANG